MPVIPAKAGIHFDFLPGGVATTLLLRGARIRNSENSPFVFVFDSDPLRSGVKTSERGGEKAKAKMDSGFRRNDEQNRTASCRDRSRPVPTNPSHRSAPCPESRSQDFFNNPDVGGFTPLVENKGGERRAFRPPPLTPDNAWPYQPISSSSWL